MARSMTAYGRANVKTDLGLFLIEIHSVNRKSLDVSIHLPKELLLFDIDLRKRVLEHLKRGNISVRIQREGAKKLGSTTSSGAIEELKQLYSEWKCGAEALGYEPKEAIPFHALMNQALSATPTIEEGKSEGLKKELCAGMNEALAELMKVKSKEGRALVEDISPRVEIIAESVEKVFDIAEKSPQKYREKLTQRIKDLNLREAIEEPRLLQEIVLFTDRVDITEEVIRLRSHLKQFKELLKSDKAQLGRELDFFIQEIHREVNTIGSKAQEVEVTQQVVKIKSELEKIREQTHNIE